MSTFLELQTAVQDQVIDLPPKVQSAVPRLINDAIRSAQRRYNFIAMEGTQLYTTAEGQFTLGTVANFKEYRDQGPYIFKQLSKAQKLTTATSADIQLYGEQSQKRQPKFISTSLDPNTDITTFLIFPYPDTLSDWSGGNYIIVIPYYGYTVRLVNIGDTNWFTNNMDDYIITKAVGEAFGLDWDNDNMAIWLQRAEEKFKEVKKADKTKRIAGVNELAILWQGGKTPPVRV